jgi:hypothetical protein
MPNMSKFDEGEDHKIRFMVTLSAEAHDELYACRGQYCFVETSRTIGAV